VTAAAPSVVVFDYGSGNLRSAVRALERAGADVTLTGDRATAAAADGLVVPGVGAFAACVEGLRAVRGHEVVGRRLAGGRPVLGICVGMQILFTHGVEHGVDTPGLDEWPGVVERLQAPVVPHMGWNTVQAPEGSTLFAGIEDERFYFVHSYGVRRWELRTNGRTRPPMVTWSEHGGDRFVAAVENGPLTATQVHPEKSGDAGARLLANWVATLGARSGHGVVPSASAKPPCAGQRGRTSSSDGSGVPLAGRRCAAPSRCPGEWHGGWSADPAGDVLPGSSPADVAASTWCSRCSCCCSTSWSGWSARTGSPVWPQRW
jgi:glutamine amidotransferase